MFKLHIRVLIMFLFLYGRVMQIFYGNITYDIFYILRKTTKFTIQLWLRKKQYNRIILEGNGKLALDVYNGLFRDVTQSCGKVIMTNYKTRTALAVQIDIRGT